MVKAVAAETSESNIVILSDRAAMFNSLDPLEGSPTNCTAKWLENKKKILKFVEAKA